MTDHAQETTKDAGRDSDSSSSQSNGDEQSGATSTWPASPRASTVQQEQTRVSMASKESALVKNSRGRIE